MKAVFPCKGVVVITKQNVDVLSNYYQETLINSQLFSAYNQSNLNIQIGPFNYLPQNSNIILKKDTNLLTIQELNAVLAKSTGKPDKSKVVEEADAPLTDESIKNHPFFQTLKPLN